MIWIPIFQSCVIACKAKKDAANQYGECLKSLGFGAKEYPLSVFMERLATDYTRDCKKAIRRRKSIPKLYSKIIQKYETISDYIDLLNIQTEQTQNKIRKMKNTINADKDLLKQIKKHWITANQTGIITPEMGAANLGELRKSIDEIKKRISVSEDALDNLESELDSKEISEKEPKSNQDLYEDLNQYRYKITILYQKIDRIGSKYEKILNHYWRTLIKNLNGIPIRQKSFSDVCQSCNVQMFTQYNLFHDEREMINSKIKHLAGFKVDI